MKKILLLAGLALISSPSFASNDEMTKTVTIYGNSPSMWNYRPLYSGGALQGSAVITKSKIFEFKEGLNKITVSNLPIKIDPSSIVVKNLSVGKSIVEQEFKSTVFNLGMVLEETIGEEIEVEQTAGDRMIYHRGTLVSTSPNLVIEEDDRLRVLKDYSSIILADRDSEANSNTVNWEIVSEEDSDDILEYAYKTEGVSWSASYSLFVEENSSEVFGKLESWANIYNNTNLEAKGTELKLVAGKVNSVQSPNMEMMRAAPMMVKMNMAEADAPSFSEESFSDYHMYRLNRMVDFEPFSSKKIKLYDDKNRVHLVRRYEFDSNRGGNDVRSIIKAVNDKESNLAIPLPAGKVTIYEKDSTGSFEKSGEAKIAHTPIGDKAEFEIGKAFDIKAKKTRVDNRRDNARRYGSYTVKVELENSKNMEVTVYVKEQIYNQNWNISNSSHTYKKISSNQVEFPISIPPKGKVALKYKVDYNW